MSTISDPVPPRFTIQRASRVRRIVASVIVGLIALRVLWSVITNPNFRWDVVAQYFTFHNIMVGLWNTVQLTVLAMLLSLVLGLVAALMRMSQIAVLRWLSAAYLWVFRGTPLLVQIVLLFNISALYPTIGLNLGFVNIGPIDVNSILTPFMVGVLALGVNEGAYMAEIIRSGLMAVPPGQREAARALGMKPGQLFTRIVLPQSMKYIIPPTGNQLISMLKSTSLVSVIAFPDLLYSVQSIYARTYQTIPLLMVASLWYLFITSLLMIVQHYIERYFSAGTAGGRRAPAQAAVDPVASAKDNA